MNSFVINSSITFNHSSSGSSPQLSDTITQCTDHYAAFVYLFIERSINLVVGYPANIMVMWLVAREKSDSSTSNNFIFNLAIADAWFCIMSPICCFGFDILGIGYFTYVLHFTTGIKNGSPLFLACICLDRYMAVVHPIVFTSIKDNKIRVAISVLVWGLVIAYALCKSLLISFSFEIFSGLILAGFTIMVYCNVSLIWSLRKSVLGKEKMHPMKKKALRTVQIYLGIIVFHYLPVAIISLLRSDPDVQEYCTTEIIIFSHKDYTSITQP
ncbi:hypothetical protein GJAV_G00142940, partial [Gymnothorax javanicus]